VSAVRSDWLAVLPAYNEGQNLARVVADLRAGLPGVDILVVDDASDDDTDEVVESLGVYWLRLGLRLGVGGAVRAGLRYAKRNGYRGAVRVDADGQHPAGAARLLIETVESQHADAASGSRYQQANGYQTPAGRRLAQRVLSGGLSLLTGRSVTDPTSGLWAFGPRALRLLAHAHPTGYAEPELTLLLAAQGLRVVEVPVEMRARAAGESTLTMPRAMLALARAALAMVIVPLQVPLEELADD
jgi:glycosyltransferase involved in cell wall biosynthesis